MTARHVLKDEASDHHPDSILIDLHVEPDNAALVTQFMIPLFKDQKSVWREGFDSGGEVDVAVVELDRSALPERLSLKAFTPDHLVRKLDEMEVGASIPIVGFPRRSWRGPHRGSPAARTWHGCCSAFTHRAWM